MTPHRSVEALLLIATALLLIGHGGDVGPHCGSREPQEDVFDVVGSCGDPGQVTIKSAGDSCVLRVQGDRVGLPLDGENESGWRLEGPRQPGAEPSRCRLISLGELRREANCYDEDGNHECTTFLIDESESCDIESCEIPSCGENERLKLGPENCCPACEPCASCAADQPEEEEEVCDPEACPELSCEAHFEKKQQGCCEVCVPMLDENLCAEGLATYEASYVAAAQKWSGCKFDEDCRRYQASTRCGYHCELVVNQSRFGQHFAELSAEAKELCQHCVQPEFDCEYEELTLACVEGQCVVEP